MLTAAVPASPPDIAAILTSLGVFSLAIAAAVGGIYKGLKEVNKEESVNKNLRSASPLDEATAQNLIQSNLHLAETVREAISSLRSLDRRGESLTEALNDHRAIVRSQIEEQHRVRAAIVDLTDRLRRN